LPETSINCEYGDATNDRAKATSKQDPSFNAQQMRDKENDPNARDLAREQSKQTTSRSQAIQAKA
jgi:hypothetical protein